MPLRFPDLQQSILWGLLGVLLIYDYLRLMLLAWAIEPPLIDGVYYLGYFSVGGIAILLFIAHSRVIQSTYSLFLALLLLLLALAPFWSTTFLTPQYRYLLPDYLGLAFGCAVYAAFGFLYAKRGLTERAVVVAWTLMLAATIPAIIEMFSNGIGSSTRVARAALHITLGDHFLFATVLAIATIQSRPLRLGLYALGVVALLALGSRTALYAFLPLLPVLLLLGGTTLTRWALAPVLLAISVLLAPIAFQTVFNSSLRESRMFGFLTSMSSDSAWQGRLQALESGWQDIQKHPLLGSFGSHIEQFGAQGMYIHNYLELWRQFGILPFGIFAVLLTLSLIRAVGALGSIGALGSRSAHALTVLLFLTPLLTQIVFSRSYGYPQIFFVLGISAAVALNSHNAVRRGQP